MTTTCPVPTVPLLALVPSYGLRLNDDQVKQLIYSLLGVDEPSAFQSAIFAASSFDSLLLGWIASRFAKNLDLTPARVQQAMPVLIQLFRRMVESTPNLMGAALPNLRVLRVDDPALSNLRCMGGAFAVDHVYAAHPCDARLFLPVASYHEQLLQDKKGEFVHLLAALGARKIEFRSEKTRERSVEGHAGGKLGKVRLGPGGTGQQTVREHVFDQHEFPEPSKPPTIPEGLRWLTREPLWAQTVRERLEHGVLRRLIRFEHVEDHGVTAEVGAVLQGLKFSLGGSYNSLSTVDEEYEVEFYPVGR